MDIDSITTGQLIAGVISLCLTLLFFVLLARIASNTKDMELHLRTIAEELTKRGKQ